MRVFISADIEGTAGILSWDETERTHADYAEFRALMTAEVLAACEGARAAGATEIVIKDAHDSGRNLILERLPAYARIVRGWSGHPDAMMFGVDESFDAALYTGYHSKAGTEDNPLAHTSTLRISRLTLNGETASEFTLNALCAARYGVPSLFLSGDEGICADAKALVPGIATVGTLKGVGAATISLTPAAARAAICEGVERALRDKARQAVPRIPENIEIVIEFSNPADAYRASWYPGVRRHGPRAVAFRSDDFFEVLRAFRFMKS
ncbi:M55 family metallopeptidase [Mesorhizobium sp. LHD-90]|uniref:M55 family metallopeptidase n=1 Tax=Mesorhizobium sp. LHD-90 TaxID=3071414 RepID=UPI0027E16290|nr:M55 family metallopeptidase [Mesorhizobium sp. LHD-90]MDQ6432832.1 M55 family metallopeptidase [Mesorhizobium sp. LHD-90]